MFPNKALQRRGDVFTKTTGEFFNRTGATIAKGSVVAMDLLQSATETDSILVGDDGSVFANVVTCTQAMVDAGFPLLVAEEDVADDAAGSFVLYGVADVSVLDDDVSTTDTDAGDALAMLVSESAISVQAAAATAHRALGIALEDGDVSGAGSADLKRCIWTGGVPVLGYSIDG